MKMDLLVNPQTQKKPHMELGRGTPSYSLQGIKYQTECSLTNCIKPRLAFLFQVFSTYKMIIETIILVAD